MEEDYKRNDKGQFNGKQPTSFTQENASEMAKRGHQSRQEKAIEAAEKGLMMGLPPEDVARDVYGGIASMIAALTRMVFQEKGHASVRAAELVLKMNRALPDQTSESMTIKATIPADLALKMAKRLQDEAYELQKEKREVVNAETSVHDEARGELLPDVSS